MTEIVDRSIGRTPILFAFWFVALCSIEFYVCAHMGGWFRTLWSGSRPLRRRVRSPCLESARPWGAIGADQCAGRGSGPGSITGASASGTRSRSVRPDSTSYATKRTPDDNGRSPARWGGRRRIGGRRSSDQIRLAAVDRRFGLVSAAWRSPRPAPIGGAIYQASTEAWAGSSRPANRHSGSAGPGGSKLASGFAH